jgi:hypothetical protein
VVARFVAVEHLVGWVGVRCLGRFEVKHRGIPIATIIFKKIAMLARAQA